MNLALALLTGACLVLIFPRFDFTWLTPVALAPLLLACARELSWRRRFLLGWVSGTLFWFALCAWIQFVLEVHGGMGRWGGWGTFVLFALLKGLYTAAFALFAGFAMARNWAIPAVAVLWVAVEYSHATIGLAWIGLGFEWLHLGNAAVDWPWLMRLAPITGVLGLSFALAMISCAAALFVLRRPAHNFAWLGLFVVLAALPAEPGATTGLERAQVVQPDIDTETRWTQETFTGLETRLADLSKDEAAPLIVWPEAPAPFYPDRPAFAAYISSVAASAHASLLFGGIGQTTAGDPVNSAFLLDASGRLVDHYDKIQLVPFGEYIPPAFGWVNRITGEAGDFVPGTRLVTLPIDGHRVGTFICYESAFPDQVRRFTLEGAQLLVNLSNDGYFGDSDARAQHLALVRMRAAENRRWILRATNDGITAMIDPAGRVTERIPEHTQTSELMHFNYESELTFYAQHGDWFPLLCLAACLGAGALSYAGSLRRRRL